MKKSIIIGIITGIVAFLFVISCGMTRRTIGEDVGRNDAEPRDKTGAYPASWPVQDMPVTKNVNK